MAFSHRDQGGITLFGEDAKEYENIVRALHRLEPDKVSAQSVANSVQEALLQTIDINGLQKDLRVDERAKSAAERVDKLLSSAVVEWTIGFPISGLIPGTGVWKIGDSKIGSARDAELLNLVRRADQIADQTIDPITNQEAAKKLHHERLIEEHVDSAFLILTVAAADAEAAWQVAKRNGRFLLDCLNLAIESISGSGQFYALSDSEPARRPRRTGLVVGSTSAVLQSELDSVISMECDQLRLRISETPLLTKMLEFLANPRRNAHQDRILSAVHWAGRAAVERRIEQAFLGRAIALESLLLGRNDGEITKSLAYSVAHLLGDWLADRPKAFAQIKKLYAVRSKIVHSGKYEVDRADAALLRQYVFACLARLFEDSQFSGMSKADDLDNWLQLSMLGKSAPVASDAVLPADTD